MNRPIESPASGALHVASRLADIEPFHVVALAGHAIELEAQGRSIINMVIGEPDFPTPRPIVDAGIEALRNSQIRYTASLGGNDLCSALQNWYQTRYGVDLPRSRIAVTSGGSPHGVELWRQSNSWERNSDGSDSAGNSAGTSAVVSVW